MLAVESTLDLRIEVREPGRVRGRVVAPGGVVPPGMRVALVPTLLRPSALYPAEEAPVDASGAFDVGGTVGEHEVVVRGTPPGWVVRTPPVWLAAGQVIGDLRIDVGPVK